MTRLVRIQFERRIRAFGRTEASVALALLGFLFQACVCHAQNLAQNPGFESGNTSGWFPFGSPAISAQTLQVHSGNYAARVQNRTATWNGIAQSFQGVIQPGQPYNISTWCRLVSGSSQTMQLTIQKVDGGGTSYSAVASGAVSSNGWVQLSGQYTLNVSGTLTSLTLYLEVPSSSTAEYYADDLLVEAVGSGGPGTNGTCTVNWQDVYQRIDGFGASSAWRSTWNTTVADRYFSTNTGIGLSLLRTRIEPGGTTVENSIMQMARDRGARVWSAPWSPAPASQFKSNGSVNGGSFIGNAANYQAYANQLAGYVVNMKNQYGVTLYALSVQNEPDANVTTYESCNWTAQQIHDFVPYLSGALVASNVGATKIMLPESQNWTDPQGLYLTTMNDAAVAPLVGIVANHNYVQDNNNGDQSTPAAINAYGKALWETEVSTFNSLDSSMNNGIYWARRIHSFLTVAQVNAWHYWWLSGANNEGLADSSDVLAKRGYVLGQYSRFVRPDYYRIGVVTNSGTALVSAYRTTNGGNFAIVAINAGSGSITQAFNLNAFGSVSSVTPWITSAALSLASQTAVTVSNSAFTYALPGQSVVTFVGQAINNSAPTNISLSSSTVAENQTINTTVGTLSTSDPDSGDTFTYTLVSGTGSTDNGSFNISASSLRTSASFDYESQSSYSIRVRSTDQGSLFFEKVFNITVADTNESPSLAVVSDRTINAGVTLKVTNEVTDAESPPQILTFSLLSTDPTNATLDTNSGIFTWRPLVSQADTTNVIVVKVSDNGTPSLSDTNSYTVTVNPLAHPTLDSISTAGGQVSLVANGPFGPDYTLWSSTNLFDWQVLFTTNSPVSPVTFVDTNLNEPVRFYRIQLGP